jgi:hypothetical protein
MNPRIDSQPENHLVSTVSGFRTSVDQIKQAQRMGARSLKTFINQNAGSYDFSATLAPGATSITTIIFTSSIQKYAIADLTYRIYANSLSNEIHPDMTSSSLWPNPKITFTPPSTSTPLVTSWSMKIFGVGFSGSNTFYVKLFVQSTDQGTISP